MANSKKSCYVISPIGEQESLTRKEADLILKYVIEPAAERAGFQKPVRAERDSDPSIITNTTIKHVFEDDLVIAVLSGKNANVFYELAYRHTLNKPCVHLIDERSWPPPFDVSGMNIIRYDLSDWRSPEKTISELINAIKSANSATLTTNPISTAMAVHKLVMSENPEVRKEGLIAEQLQTVLAEMNELKRIVKTQKSNNFITGAGISVNPSVFSGQASASHSANLGTVYPSYFSPSVSPSAEYVLGPDELPDSYEK